jgi:hypothetical protein
MHLLPQVLSLSPAASALCVRGLLLFSLWLCQIFKALAAAVSEEHSCVTLICRRVHTICNIPVKLDADHHGKRGERAIGIKYVLHILGMMIFTILMGA